MLDGNNDLLLRVYLIQHGAHSCYPSVNFELKFDDDTNMYKNNVLSPALI